MRCKPSSKQDNLVNLESMVVALESQILRVIKSLKSICLKSFMPFGTCTCTEMHHETQMPMKLLQHLMWFMQTLNIFQLVQICKDPIPCCSKMGDWLRAQKMLHKQLYQSIIWEIGWCLGRICDTMTTSHQTTIQCRIILQSRC